MPDEPISLLPAGSAPTSATIFPVTQSGNTVSITMAQVGFYIRPAVSTKTSGYTVLSADNGGLIVMNCSTAATVTLGAASGYPANFSVDIVSMGAGAITLDVGSGINWWGSSLAGRYATLGSRSTVWTDGTYWYCSPVDVEAYAGSTARVLSAGGQTSWTAVDLSTYVPVSAKTVWGVLTFQASSASSYLGVSARSDGLGSTGIGYTGANINAGFRLTVKTPQKLWYVISGGTGMGYIDITGFGF